MSEKENKYSYFISYMYMTDDEDIYLPGNMQLDIDRVVKTAVDIRRMEEVIEEQMNAHLKGSGVSNTVELVFITNFILLSGGDSPALDEKLAVAGKALKEVKQIIREIQSQGRPASHLDGAVEIITKAQDKISQEL